jgi:PAS domain S-box-containing protein
MSQFAHLDLFENNPQAIVLCSKSNNQYHENQAAKSLGVRWAQLLKLDDLLGLSLHQKKETLLTVDNVAYKIIIQNQKTFWVWYIQPIIQDLELENQKRYQTLVETSGNFIYQSDYQGNFTFVNAIGISKIGYTKEKLIGLNFTQLVIPEKRTEVAAFYKKQFENRIPETYYEFPIHTFDGKLMWIAQTVQLIKNGDLVDSFQAYASDITEKKQLQEQLLSKSILLNNILDSLPLLVYLKSENNDYIFINESADSIFKGEEERFELLQQIDRESDKVWKTKKSEEKILQLTIQGKRKFYLCGKKIVNAQDSKKPMLLGYAMDITDKKNIEENLKLTKHKYEYAQTQSELLLSLICHHIRTPMQAILGVNNLILANHKANNKAYHQLIGTASNGIIKILNEVRELDKISQPKFSLERTNFDIQKLVSEIVKKFQNQLSERNIQLLEELDPKLPNYIYGSKLMLFKILDRLLEFSISRSKHQQITLSLSLIQSNDEFSKIKFVVSDDGLLLSPSSIKNLNLGLFADLPNDNILPSIQALQLSIARSMIEKMGAQFIISNKPKNGIEVFFEASFENGYNDSDEEIGMSEIQLDGNFKVLLAEDDELNQLVIKDMLESQQIKVLTAIDGKEALEMIQNQSFDLVLMDLQMPEMDGFEAIKKIRKKLNLTAAALPVVAITAEYSLQMEDKIKQAGFNEMLLKPISLEVFTDCLIKYSKKVNVLSPELNTFKDLQEADSDLLIDLSYLVSSSRNNQEFIHKMVSIFISQTPNYLSEMFEYLEVKDYTMLYQIAHKYKPTTVMMGMKILNLIDRIEYLAKSSTNQSELYQLINEVKEKSMLAIAQLSKYLENHK